MGTALSIRREYCGLFEDVKPVVIGGEHTNEETCDKTHN